MILVTVGTTEFNGLVKAADELTLADDVVIQKSDGSYIPQQKEFFEYSEDFDDYVKKADVVVTHGGAGTIFKLLSLGKKIVGVANEERSDLHQWDLLKKLSDLEHLSWCKDVNDLESCIKQAKEKDFQKYTKPKNSIARDISHNY